MNWFNKIKRMFLIKLLRALGFGSVIAYSICGCDSKSASVDVQKPDSVQESQTANSTAETQPVEEPKTDAPVVDTQENAENSVPEPDVAQNSQTETDAQEMPANDEPKEIEFEIIVKPQVPKYELCIRTCEDEHKCGDRSCTKEESKYLHKFKVEHKTEIIIVRANGYHQQSIQISKDTQSPIIFNLKKASDLQKVPVRPKIRPSTYKAKI